MWTAEEIFEGYANSPHVGAHRVHWQRRVPFGGSPGHYYFLRGRDAPLTGRQMAQISKHSRNAEAALFLINATYVVYIGNVGIASATFRIPPRQAGIQRFHWISHTHPQEMESEYERAPGGPSDDDETTLRELRRRWGQTDSVIIVCRDGEVESEVTFQPTQTEEELRRRPGRVWTPSFD